MWWPGLPTTFRRDFPPDMTLWHIRGSKGKGCAEDLGGGGVWWRAGGREGGNLPLEIEGKVVEVFT